MTNKDLYNSMTAVDEKFLIEREEGLKAVKAKSAVIKAAAGIAACICAVALVFFIEKDVLIVSPDETTAAPDNITEASTGEDIHSHGGDGNSYIIEISEKEQLPTELFIDSELQGSINYLSEIFTGDQYSEENRTAEKEKSRLDALKEYLKLSSISDYSIEYGADLFPYTEFSDARITSLTSCIIVDSEIFINSGGSITDSEISEILCKNIYTVPLISFLGIDKSNLYIHRETILLYDEENISSSPVSKQTVFRITEFSDIPQELSLNLQSNYIRFTFIEDYVGNSVTVSPLYAYFTPSDSKREMTEFLSFEDAVSLAVKSTEKLTEDKIIGCIIEYYPDTGNGCLMPFYKFFYKTDNNSFSSVSVPLDKNGLIRFR